MTTNQPNVFGVLCALLASMCLPNQISAADVTYPAPINGTQTVVIGGAAPSGAPSSTQVKVGGGQIHAGTNVTLYSSDGSGRNSTTAHDGQGWYTQVSNNGDVHQFKNQTGTPLAIFNHSKSTVVVKGVAPLPADVISGEVQLGGGQVVAAGALVAKGTVAAGVNSSISLAYSGDYGYIDPVGSDGQFASIIHRAKESIFQGTAPTTVGVNQVRIGGGYVRADKGVTIGQHSQILVADGTSLVTDARWVFRNGTNTHAALRVIANNTTELTVDAVQADNSTTTKHLVFNPNGGNVGIGMSNPTNKLSVNGTISAKEIKVTTTGADYVFADGYWLRPLQEVERFIAEHKHLPEMMPAVKMQLEGMPVSEVVTKQLAKIEELTLYAIEADKKNKELTDRLAAIERMLGIGQPAR